MDISLFEKCELYLLKNNIELTDEDRYTDRRLGIEGDTIYKWDFALLKPSMEELNKLTTNDIDKLRKKKKINEKVKRINSFQFPVLSNEEMLNITQLNDNLFISEETGDLYLYYKKTLKKVRLE